MKGWKNYYLLFASVIGINTFFDCINLKEIVILASVKLIDEEAFSSCIKLEKVNLLRIII